MHQKMDNKDILQLIAKQISSPSAFYNFSVANKICAKSAQIYVLEKKDEFKQFEVAMKSENDDLIGGYFFLPNMTQYPKNVIVISEEGHFEMWSQTDVIDFAHGHFGNLF